MESSSVATDILFPLVALLCVVAPVLVGLIVLWWSRRRESVRRAHQLNSVYNAQIRRERGEGR